MRYLALVLLAVLSVGSSCSNLPPITVCYEHPTHGRICVELGSGGEKTIHDTSKPLTDAQLAEVREWLDKQK